MVDNRKLYPSQFDAISKWVAYMHSFGLGKPLGIDMEGEASGLIPDAAYLRKHHTRWNGTTVMWMGMGQGEVTTTPLQLCNMAALIANRGWYITPHIHQNLTGVADTTFTTRHYVKGTTDAFDVVIRGMRACVINGTAASINRSDYRICGKTGTAENEGVDHSIFMGFAPMEKPKVAISVYVENGGFGADLAAPIASLIIEQQVNGSLSEKSKIKAQRLSSKKVKITPVEVIINFDDL